MEPLEIFALDKNFNRLTGSLPYRSLQWNRRYYEPGQFEVHVPSSIYSPDWAYIYTEDRPETGIIQKREYTDDSEVPGGDDTIRLVGYFTERWLYDYTFLVEDTAIEEEYIYKPAPKTIFVGNEPELYVNGVGDIYVMRGDKLWTADGTPTNFSTNGMERLEYEPAKGVTTYMAGKRPMWYQDTRYNYFDDENGDFCRVDANGKVEKVDAAGVTPITITGNTYGASDGVVFIEDGKWQWATNYYSKLDNTYVRQVEKWEESTKGLKKDPGGTVAVLYRTVKGPWNLRTAVEEVGKPRDNCQAIITWAQRMWGNSVCYDEPDFKGVTKVLDPSVQNFGEFTFKELATIGASVRMFYSFVSNVSVFQIWCGRDLTQRANKPKPPEERTATLTVEHRAATGSGQLTGSEGAEPDTDLSPEPSDLSPWVVFSDTWGSMHGFTYSVDESNYRNKCYVMYEYDEPMMWEANGAPGQTDMVVLGSDNTLDSIDNYPGPVAQHIPYKTKQGYKTVRLDDDMRDIECYLDMRDAKPECDQDWPRGAISSGSSEDEGAGGEGSGEEQEPTWNPEDHAGLQDVYKAWPKVYEASGKQELSDKYPIERELDTGTLSQDEYLTTWDLGDVVDMSIYAMGVLQEARITGVDEAYESGSVTIKPQFGEVELMQTVQEEE